MVRPSSPEPAGSAPVGRARSRRALLPVMTLAVVLLAAVLAGRAERAEPGVAVGVDAASVPEVAPEDAVAADIVVVRGERERHYSSTQLPPDGRLVFRRYVEGRDPAATVHPPVAIADWIFRVVPDADEVRITLREPVEGTEIRYEYRREAPSPT